MTGQERGNYIRNNHEIIANNMALHDEEVRNRKLEKFILSQVDPVTNTSWYDSSIFVYFGAGFVAGVVIGQFI